MAPIFTVQMTLYEQFRKMLGLDPQKPAEDQPTREASGEGFDDDFFGAAEGDKTGEDIEVTFDEFGGEAPDGEDETPWEARERRKRRRPCRN